MAQTVQEISTVAVPNINNSGTYYMPWHGHAAIFNTDPDKVCNPWGLAGTFDHLFIHLTEAPGGFSFPLDEREFTFMVDTGSGWTATDLTVVFTGGSGQVDDTDTTNSYTIAEGTRICLRSKVNFGTPETTQMYATIRFTGEDGVNKICILGGTTDQLSSTSDEWFTAMGRRAKLSDANKQWSQSLIPGSFTAVKAFVFCTTAPGGTDFRNFDLYKNNSSFDASTPITISGTEQQDSNTGIMSWPFSATDQISWKCRFSGGTPADTYVGTCVVLQPGTQGQYPEMNTTDTGWPSNLNVLTRIHPPCTGDDPVLSSPFLGTYTVDGLDVEAIYVEAWEALTFGIRTFTVRVGAADTGLSCVLTTSAQSANDTGTEAVASGKKIDIECVSESALSSGNTGGMISLLMNIDPVEASALLPNIGGYGPISGKDGYFGGGA